MTDYRIHTFNKATDKTLYNLAKNELGNGSRWTEFLLETKPNSDVWKAATQLYNDGVRVKIPVVSPPLVSDSFTLSEDMNVRTSIVTTDDKNIIYAAGSKTKFTYDKSSLVTDAIGRVWAKVIFSPPYKNKTGTAYPEGRICVKEGTTFYTAEKIDVPVAKTAKG